MAKPRVLFLCTGNSCRSQMAEAFLRQLGGDRFEALSAGTQPTGQIHPLAVRVMAEAGVDLAGHTSKSVELFRDQPLDCVVSVCDRARQACPVFPGAAQRLHWGFDDPAAARGGPEEQLAVFRRVRDEIRRRIQLFLAKPPAGEPR